MLCRNVYSNNAADVVRAVQLFATSLAEQMSALMTLVDEEPCAL